MIYTDLENLKHYQGINKNLDTAIRYLIEKGTENLVPGRNDVDGDNVFVNEFSYMTIPESEAIFEAHFDYADVHMVLSGSEYIGVTDIKKLEVTNTLLKLTLRKIKTDKENDCILGNGKVENMLLMTPGKVLIVLPEDAHMVKVQNGTAVEAKKAVMKIKVN